jgi:hypothetical protein
MPHPCIPLVLPPARRRLSPVIPPFSFKIGLEDAQKKIYVPLCACSDVAGIYVVGRISAGHSHWALGRAPAAGTRAADQPVLFPGSPVAVESLRQPPPEREPRMRVGISGTHGTGKTTLAQALCARLPGYVAADEPYYVLEEQGYEFGFPPSLEDYRALLACSVRSLTSPPLQPGALFDRTPLDYLAYMAATGADPSEQVGTAELRPAFANLDLLVITLITPEMERVLPAAEIPGLRAEMTDALLELVYDDPLNAWGDVPVLELSGALDGRLDVVLATLDRSPATSSDGTGRPDHRR